MKVSPASPRAARIRSRSRARVDGAHVGEDARRCTSRTRRRRPRRCGSSACWAAGVVGTGSTVRPRVAPARLPPRAEDRAAALYPPGVERDDVEAIEQLGREHGQLVGEVVDARRPRAAGVDDERPDPFATGPRPGAGPRRSGWWGRRDGRSRGARSPSRTADRRRPSTARGSPPVGARWWRWSRGPGSGGLPDAPWLVVVGPPSGARRRSRPGPTWPPPAVPQPARPEIGGRGTSEWHRPR